MKELKAQIVRYSYLDKIEIFVTLLVDQRQYRQEISFLTFRDQAIMSGVTSKINFFCVKEFFRLNFDFKNGCKNEFKDNNEKSCT